MTRRRITQQTSRVRSAIRGSNTFGTNHNTSAMRIGAEGLFMIAKRGALTSREARSCKSDSRKLKLVVNDFFGNETSDTKNCHVMRGRSTCARMSTTLPQQTDWCYKGRNDEPAHAPNHCAVACARSWCCLRSGLQLCFRQEHPATSKHVG